MKFATRIAMAAAQSTLNRILALDPATPHIMAPLQGEVFHFAMTDLEVDLYLLPGAHQVRLLDQWDGTVTTTLRGESREFVAVLRAPDAAAELINSSLQLQGDSQALNRLQSALKALDPDWEASLARWLGDIPAHALGRGIRSSWRWMRGAGESLARQTRDYWREESDHLVPREAWEDFATAVDDCRQDTDRLVARLARLRQAHGPGGPIR